MGRLTDKRILLTGASSGIGVATADRLAGEGADLALVARGDGLAEAARLVRLHGRQAHEIRADLGDRAELSRALADCLKALGGLDVVVLNASVARRPGGTPTCRATCEATRATTQSPARGATGRPRRS